MIAFDGLNLEAGTPIYLQILQFVKRGAVAGTIHDGDELPSRRVLSSLLGVNPNTVQKAYHLLEEEGLVQSRLGAKSCMVLDETTIARIRQELLAQSIRSIAASMRQMGLSKQEALELIEKLWE